MPDLDIVDNTPAIAPGWFVSAVEKVPQSHFFHSNGLRLHYLSWTDDGFECQADSKKAKKPVLLFVHGFRGHAHWWGYIAPFFVEQYRVYALDLSGMGDSDNRSEYDNDCHGADILALIEHLGLDSTQPVTVVGHSFGGARIFRAAGQRPELFKKIVAMDAHVFFAGDTEGYDPAPQTRQRFYPDLQTGMSRFRLAPDQPRFEAYIMDFLAEHSLRQTKQGWTWTFDHRMNVAQFICDDGETMLAKVLCPVDIIYGENSAVVSAHMAQKIMDTLPNSQKIIEIPGSYHHLMISDPVAAISTLQALI